MRFPLIIFIVIPIAELLLLFKVADLIGGGWTLLLVIITAFIGISLLKRQGISTWQRASGRMRGGQLPGQEIIEGMLLAFAGALLLTPGLITDTIGFVLLTPPLRHRIARRIMRSGTSVMFGSFTSVRRGPMPPGESGDRGTIVEGDYTNEDSPRLNPRDDDSAR
jgi:UPF0716 protein FxsA